MPRYIIHIGPHKTGTSYLQAAFAACRDQLEQRGVWYPDTWSENLGHHKLAAELRAGISQRPLFLAMNASRYDTVLLSAEDLADLRSERIAELRELIGTSAVRVVFYCRRWSELVPSGWQETIKHGSTSTLPEFLTPHAINPDGSNILNYGHTIRRFAEHFGLANISLVSYSNLVDSGADLWPHFCRLFLNWPDPPKPQRQRVNESMILPEVELIRVLNMLGSDRNNLQAYRHSGFNIASISGAMETATGTIRMNEGVGVLLRLHEELWREFGHLMVQPYTEGRLFAPKNAELRYVRPDYLLTPGIADRIRSLHQELRA
jgi:hypothetical protein